MKCNILIDMNRVKLKKYSLLKKIVVHYKVYIRKGGILRHRNPTNRGTCLLPKAE